MPKNKDLKRLIRARMAKTGESYTAARNQLLASDLPLPEDYAKLAGMSDAAVRDATGRDWVAWAKVLDAQDASSWPHADIARWLMDEHGVGGWWAQGVTVAYERFRGLRDVGQRRGGGYDMNKTKTVGVSFERLKAAFSEPGERDAWVRDLELDPVPTRSHQSLRFRAPDGRTVAAWFVEKGDERATVSVQVEGLPTKEEADAHRAAWGERLDRLKARLEA